MEHLTEDNFEAKTGEGTAVVDFYADWCGPCKRLAPMFEELSGEVDGASFLKVDVEEETDLAMRFGVQSIPTIIVFKDGEVAERLMGLMPKEELKKAVEKHV